MTEAPAPVPAEVRYLAPRSLMARWDCSKSSVYRALDEMTRMGIYRGIFVGKDRRVALAAVELYERHLERHTSLQGTCAPAPVVSAPPRATVVPLPRRPETQSVPPSSTYRHVVDRLFGRRPTRRRVSVRAAGSGRTP